ncbi:MAG: phosphatidylglycerophosphatase A [Anaerorhabdus sp.]
MYQQCLELLKQRGVELKDIADCVFFLQEKFYPDLTVQETEEMICGVISKREVQHAILTGINMDIMAENKQLVSKDLEKILNTDYSLYGVDEVLAYGICNIYGSIALTNFGYIDRMKPGIIGKLNSHESGHCHTFLDDIVGAIAASAASRLAHSKGEKEDGHQ